MERTRLEHALLYVRDLEESLAFYRTLLPDWTVRWDGRPGGEPWVHIGPPHDPSEPQPGYLSIYEWRGAKKAPSGRLAVDHIGFAHPDVEGLVRRLREAGVRPSDRTEDPAYRRAYFTDPSGHELEFVQKLA